MGSPLPMAPESAAMRYKSTPLRVSHRPYIDNHRKLLLHTNWMSSALQLDGHHTNTPTSSSSGCGPAKWSQSAHAPSHQWHDGRGWERPGRGSPTAHPTAISRCWSPDWHDGCPQNSSMFTRKVPRLGDMFADAEQRYHYSATAALGSSQPRLQAVAVQRLHNWGSGCCNWKPQCKDKPKTSQVRSHKPMHNIMYNTMDNIYWCSVQIDMLRVSQHISCWFKKYNLLHSFCCAISKPKKNPNPPKKPNLTKLN